MESQTIRFTQRVADPPSVEIATSGENEVRQVVFDFTENTSLAILQAAVPILSVLDNKGTLLEEIQLDPLMDDKTAYTVTDQITVIEGRHNASIKFVDNSGAVWGSKNFELKVIGRVDGDGQVALQIEPTIITQIIAKAAQVEANTEEVADNTVAVAGSAAQVAQVMADILAMMGIDIATLTNGKLTPSQVPAIAVTNTSVVNSEAAMLALDAQTGDVCIRTDESKTYILESDNPTELTAWKEMIVPTDYAATAGHAATADEATNAAMINGHRVVYMTQAQYDVAVKDPDTIYLVGV